MKWSQICVLLCFLSLPILVFAYMNKSSEAMPKHLLLIANQGDDTLGIIDPDAGRELAKIPNNGVRAHEVAASPDGKVAYLPIYGDSGVGKAGTDGQSIEIVDVAQRKITSMIQLDKPARPHCAKFGPDGMLYISSELTQSLDVIDPKQAKVVGSVPTGQPESHMFVISKDGRKAYTSNVGAGTVSALDLVGRKTIKIIPVAKNVQRIAMTIDDRYVFTADQGSPRLAVIDTAINEIKQWITLPAVGYGTAPTRDGRWLLVTMSGANQVAVVDLSQMKVVRSIDVPNDPVQILIRPDRDLAYVSCSKAGKVAVLDLKDWKVTGQLDAGPGADGMAWVSHH